MAKFWPKRHEKAVLMPAGTHKTTSTAARKSPFSWSGIVIALSILAALVFAIGHHLYYSSLDETEPDSDPDSDDNPDTAILDGFTTWGHRDWTVRIGLIFAILVILCLLVAFRIAYHQYITFTLLRRSRPLRVVSGLYSISHNPFGLNARTPLSFPIVLAWALGLLLFITPFTLDQAESNALQTTQYQDSVPTLEFGYDARYDDDPDTVVYPSAYYVVDTDSYRQYDKGQEACRNLTDPGNPFVTCDNIVGGPGIPSKKVLQGGLYGGPANAISRASMSTALTGQTAPNLWVAPNTSYTVNFTGPAVLCLNATSNIYAQLAAATNLSTLVYHSWVPQGNTSNFTVDLDQAASPSTLDTTSLDYARLYVAFPQKPTRIFECGLYNNSYSIDFSFKPWEEVDPSNKIYYGGPAVGDPQTTNHSSAAIRKLTKLNPIAYLNDTVRSERLRDGLPLSEVLVYEAHKSYLGYMQALGAILAGSITYDNSDGQGYSQSTYHTSIMNTNLAPALNIDGTISIPDAINMAIIELSVNITLSLFHSPLFTRYTTADVTLYSTVPGLYYHARPLWLAYGIAIGLITLFSLFGAFCARKNGLWFHPSMMEYVSAGELGVAERAALAGMGLKQLRNVRVRGKVVDGAGGGEGRARRVVFAFEGLTYRDSNAVAFATPPESPAMRRRSTMEGRREVEEGEITRA